LGRDRDPHLVGDVQTITANEGLLGHKHLDVALELELQVGGQRAHIGHAALQDVTPGGRKRPGTNFLALALGQIGLAEQPENKEQRQRGNNESWQKTVPTSKSSTDLYLGMKRAFFNRPKYGHVHHPSVVADKALLTKYMSTAPLPFASTLPR
jgi:hypothetical protein